MPADTSLRALQPDSAPLGGGSSLDDCAYRYHRYTARPARPAVPASTPLRARNPTPRRLGAARVWTIERVDNIAIQPDLTGHKSEPVRSFRVPGFCGAYALSLLCYCFLRYCRPRSAVPTATLLRARNPTLRRLWAARVWTLERIGNIAMQPDLTGHKSEPVRSFLIPGFCGAFALPLQRYRFLKPCRLCRQPLRLHAHNLT